MSSWNTGKFTVLSCASVIAMTCGIELFVAGTSHAQDARPRPAPKGKISTVPARPLDWPLPANVDKSYDAINGRRLHGYVEELAAISRKYRDAGNQWWGRIPGMPSGTESQNWVKEKFKEIGVPTETVTIPDPQDLPKSWEVSVSANGKTLKLESSQPIIDFPNFVTSPQGEEELDTVWVGLGQPADYIGKDVRGKAVVIYSIPVVTGWQRLRSDQHYLWSVVLGAGAEATPPPRRCGRPGTAQQRRQPSPAARSGADGRRYRSARAASQG